MAFLVKGGPDEILVITSHDSAVKCDQKGYDAYIKSFHNGSDPDESLLKLDGEATRFVMKRDLSWNRTQKLRTKNVKIIGKKVHIDANMTADLVRMHLAGIRNPEGVDPGKRLDFNAGPDGYASPDLMAILDRTRAVNDLWRAVASSLAEENKAESQKKS